MLLLASSLVLFLTLYGWLAGVRPLFVRSYHGKMYLLFIEPDEARMFTYEANPACGYDLRAITTGRCPECGAEATPA
jgi:hypothetical protein